VHAVAVVHHGEVTDTFGRSIFRVSSWWFRSDTNHDLRVPDAGSEPARLFESGHDDHLHLVCRERNPVEAKKSISRKFKNVADVSKVQLKI
jgi:hypothetical protein